MALVRKVLVAELVTVNVRPTYIVWSVGTVKVGGSGGKKTNSKLLVDDRGGALLSLTLTEMKFVPGDTELFVQVKTPFFMPVFVQVSTPSVVIQKLVEGDGKLKVNVESGRKLLVAE